MADRSPFEPGVTAPDRPVAHRFTKTRRRPPTLKCPHELTTQQSTVTTLRNRRNEQQELVDTLPHNAGWELASDELARIEADLAEAEEALDLCQAQEAQAANPVPQPITGKVDKIQCHDASGECGHDEPYLLVARST